ncbi:MAG: CvpA family protein [Anaerolineae bacterium]|nr:CvpA family protein [Anaerolineae bacterium]
MMQLSTFLWIMIVTFAVIGAMRGWTKEIVASAGIILALFATWQFTPILLQPLLQGARGDQVFYVYTLILVVIAFFAYQTPATARQLSEGRMWGDRRVGLQERLLGFVIGGINGYLLFGSIWYYMDVTGYPLSPYVSAPGAGSPSAAMIPALPLIFLVQGNLLTILVIVLFLFVIVAMV